MAVFESIRNFFVQPVPFEPEIIVPAPLTTYSIKPLTSKQSKEVLRLNLRCFRNGENYTRHTFAYLFGEPNTLSYQIVTASGEMAGFVFVIKNPDGAAHLTTIGVAPEHRRRGLAIQLLTHVEDVLSEKGVSTIVLEVRIGNLTAKELYISAGYAAVNRLAKYYSDGEDCFMMV
ncbi:MAG TPA: GNAT family N-acetyltransferase, partial [Pyrinomonadaceae bacterium]|nr:GNAT family N-acetyltransferase [Pyrinomonadaceae bacterium]